MSFPLLRSEESEARTDDKVGVFVETFESWKTRFVSSSSCIHITSQKRSVPAKK